MRFIVAGLFALGIAACNDPIFPGPHIAPFASRADANIVHKLVLFGGSGLWDIDLSATIHNTTSAPHTIKRKGACPVVLQAYTNADGTGVAAWQETSVVGGCKSLTVVDTIAAGDSLTIPGTHTSSTEILAGHGTPISPGVYYFYSLFQTDIPGDTVHQFVGFASLTR